MNENRKKTKIPETTRNIDFGLFLPNFLIACIGSSAGGLTALEEFFSAIPRNSGIAYIIVSHLAPDKKSMLAEIIGKRASVEVVEITDGLAIKPDKVFVIPPNKELVVSDGRLRLLELQKGKKKSSLIDVFMTSVAHQFGSRAVGIILSGTGHDGIHGISAIKEENGMVMVQEPDSAAFDGMPRNAIATGAVDFILPPGRMASELLSYALEMSKKDHALQGEKDLQSLLQQIFSLLQMKANYDFSLYKQNTICRRIERRMQIHKIGTLRNYLTFIPAPVFRWREK